MVAVDMKFVKLQIKSTQNTTQITKAVELAASSKLRRAEEKAETSVPYFSALRQTLINTAAENTDYTSVHARKDQSYRYCYALIASDHDMAGGCDANLSCAFETGSRERELAVLPLGRKARDHATQKGLECLESEKMMVASIRVLDCYAVARRLYTLFRTGEFGHISLFYTGFVSLMKQEPGSFSLLLLVDFKDEGCAACGKEGEERRRAQNLTLYEPSAEEIYGTAAPEHLARLLYSVVVNSLASEYTACRTAMKTATDNAEEVIDKLSLYCNRTCQASVTQGITEIVNGAEGSSG